MKVKKRKNGESGKEFKAKLKEYNSNDLAIALKDALYLMECCLLPFMVMRQTAKDVFQENNLSGDGVYVGVKKKYITKEVESTFKSFGVEKIGKDYYYEPSGVPIFIEVIVRNYKFFEKPDLRFFMADQYNVPNPFDRYYATRWLIR